MVYIHNDIVLMIPLTSIPMDGQHFMDVLVGNPILCIGLATVLYWLWVSYANNAVTRKLKAFPTVGSSLPILSSIDAFKFIPNGGDILDAGVRKWPGGLFKIPTPVGWWVVLTDSASIEDLRVAPENVVAAKGPNEDTLQVEYTLGPEISHNPYHSSLVRTHLNRALPKLLPEIFDEIEEAFKDYFPVTDDWTSIKAIDTSMKVLARAMNRVLVGLPLCRDPDWIRLNTVFTTEAATMGFFLRIFPEFLRPLVNYLLTPVHRHRRDALKHLGPIIAARRQEREEKGDDYPEKPADFLTWLMDEAQGEEKQDEFLVRRILTMNFVSVHTTTMNFAHALYDLALYPEYWSALREEVEEATNREGWTKAAIDQMYKVDSFIKESQRLHPLGKVVLLRKTVQEYTFSNGAKVPPGVVIAVSSITHHDPEVFGDPSKFDGLRFVKMKDRAVVAGHPDKKFDIVTTSPNSLNFGYGRTACPGRFLASADLKMMLAYVVTTYDVKLADGVRPPDWFMMQHCGPNRTAEVLFRKRRT